MPTNVYVDIACYISSPFVRVPLVPIRIIEIYSKIIPIGGVMMLWLTLEWKVSSFKLLIFMPIYKKWLHYFTFLQKSLSHPEYVFKSQLNWFLLYWFHKTSRTVNGWVMVLKHVCKFSHKMCNQIQLPLIMDWPQWPLQRDITMRLER